MKVLMTGASGFVGGAVTQALVRQKGIEVTALVRQALPYLEPCIQQVQTGSLQDCPDYTHVLHQVEVVLHIAGRAHMLDESESCPLTAFRQVNVDGTLHLAKQAAQAGVKRFVFISSIGVNGNMNNTPFTEESKAKPQEDYAISKYEAEEKLKLLAKETGLELVIIRPPLVYGANAPGNFERLLYWAQKNTPLPFGSIKNKRSLIALDNLADFIVKCATHPKAAHELFLISDGEDVSTTTLLRKIAAAFGKKATLLPVPASWMMWVARLVGKYAMANRLFGSLQVDSSKARSLLGWKPVITMDEQLQRAAEAYHDKKRL